MLDNRYIKPGDNYEDADLSGSYHFDEEYACVNFKNANLKNIEWSNISFLRCNLQGVNLENAKIKDSSFEKANLRGANLQGANLWESDFQNVDLRETNLKGANLALTDLRGAKLPYQDITPYISDIHKKIYTKVLQGYKNILGGKDVSILNIIGKEGQELEDKIGIKAAIALIYIKSDTTLDKIPDIGFDYKDALEDMKKLAKD